MNCLFFDLETDGRKIFESACCTLAGRPVTESPETLMSKISEAGIIVGHNIKSWDIPILKSLHPDIWPSSEPRIWDTLEMEAILSPLAGNLALPVTHNAVDDTRLVRGLFLSQVQRMSEAGLLETVLRILGIKDWAMPSVTAPDMPSFPQTPYRHLDLDLDTERRSLILAPRILWPFLTDIRGLTFHYSGQLDDIVDMDYTPVRKPEFISDTASLFACRFVDACAAQDLCPMVFLTPDFFRFKLRYGGASFLHLLDLGYATTATDRRLLCVDPSDFSPDLEAAYDDIVVVEREYAGLCCEHLQKKGCDLPQGISIRRIGDARLCPEGTVIRKSDFNRYDIAEKPYASRKSAGSLRMPASGITVTPVESGPLTHWDGVAAIISSRNVPLVIALVHHESDIPFLRASLLERLGTGFNFPQGYIPERKSLHKYIDLATRDRDRTGVVIAESSAVVACRFVYEGQAVILLCDDDILGIRRQLPDWTPNYDAVDRVTTAILKPVFPDSVVLRIDSVSHDADFIVSEPGLDAGSIKESIRRIFIDNGSFRGRQESCLDAILRGGNHFICLPTGTGKSLLFQGPAFCATNRLSVVFSPLKALINDQVMELESLLGRDCGVDYLHGDHCPWSVFDNIRTGRTRLLYTTPDQFMRGRLSDALRYRFDHDGGAGYIIFDEAHCISLWGRDFRPAYLHAALECTSLFPDERYLFLSATLPVSVKDDIADIISSQIHFDDDLREPEACLNEKIIPRCIHIRQEEDGEGSNGSPCWKPFEPHFEEVIDLIRGSGLDLSVSCVTVFFDDRGGTEELSRRLRAAFPEYGDRIRHYHASLTEQQKADVQATVKAGGVSIVVCTKALGMGVNIGNIHMVVHVKRPDTVEDYLQEIGRAGRSLGLMEKAHIDNIHAYCLDGSQKKGPESITTWDSIEATFRDFLQSGKGAGQEFKYHLCKGTGNDDVESRFENILFHLKRMRRINARPIRRSILARVVVRQPDNAEMNPVALCLLQYLTLRNDLGSCLVDIEDAVSFIRDHTERNVELSFPELERKMDELQKKGFILTCGDILYRIPEGPSSFSFYDNIDKLFRLFAWAYRRHEGYDAEYIRKREPDKKIRDDAKKISSLLPENTKFDFNRLLRTFNDVLNIIRNDNSTNALHLLPAPGDFATISPDELLHRHTVPVLILRKLGFIQTPASVDYAVTVLDDTPLGQASGDNDVRLRLEACNSLKRMKQTICQRLMEHLADDEGFDVETFIRDYFSLRLGAGSTKDEMLAPFSAFLDRYPSVPPREDT